MQLAFPHRALALLVLPHVHGWSVGRTVPVDVLSAEDAQAVVRWTAGNATSFTSGLKSGIAWAFDPRLCDALMPLFPEEVAPRRGLWGLWEHTLPSFFRCAHLKASIRTAMRAWEAANANVHFFEVTSLCEAAWVTPGGATSMPPSAPPPGAPPPPPNCPPGGPPPPMAPGENATVPPYEPLPPLGDVGASTPCDAASMSCLQCEYAELIISAFSSSAHAAAVAASMASPPPSFPPFWAGISSPPPAQTVNPLDPYRSFIMGERSAVRAHRLPPAARRPPPAVTVVGKGGVRA